MFNPHWTPLRRCFVFLGAAMSIAAGTACAQDSLHSAGAATESSSSAAPFFTGGDAVASSSSDAALPAAPAAPAANGGAGAGQDNGSGHGLFSRMALEFGGGFNAPSGSDQQNYITWGGQFVVGGGYRFNRHLAALLEYQFIDDKLPGRLIGETGANGGDAHIWSLTVAPVVDLFPKSTNDLYVTGGGGFYRKVTNFTDPTEYCEFYYCGTENEVIGHFSSNQGGWNIGGGFTHRMGGVYGDGRMKLFAEVRYLDVLTPAVTTEPNGLGQTSVAADTKLIPVTLGLRF
jgi:hypothetical protein